MTPDNTGIMLVTLAGIACIALSIFMERWERRGRHNSVTGNDWHPGCGLEPKVPTIEETQK